MNNSPWWAIPALTGGMALIGVLLGQTVLIASERWKVRREDQRRWHEERLKLYFEFQDEFELVRSQLHDASQKVDVELMGVDRRLFELSDKARIISTTEVSDAMSACWSHAFVCAGEMTKALDEWYEGLDKKTQASFLESVRSGEAAPIDSVREAHDEHEDGLAACLVDLLNSVRKELGVPGITGPKRDKSRLQRMLGRTEPAARKSRPVGQK